MWKWALTVSAMPHCNIFPPQKPKSMHIVLSNTRKFSSVHAEVNYPVTASFLWLVLSPTVLGLASFAILMVFSRADLVFSSLLLLLIRVS
jgi:hypothetical protein